MGFWVKKAQQRKAVQEQAPLKPLWQLDQSDALNLIKFSNRTVPKVIDRKYVPQDWVGSSADRLNYLRNGLVDRMLPVLGAVLRGDIEDYKKYEYQNLKDELGELVQFYQGCGHEASRARAMAMADANTILSTLQQHNYLPAGSSKTLRLS